MTEDAIVLNLLDFYKSKGINLEQILDDPMFKQLSLDTKILAIKKYANAISENVKRGLTKRDVSSIVGSMIYDGIAAGATAYGTAAATSKLFAGGRIHPATVAGVGLAGAIAGAALPVIRTVNKIRERNKFYDQLKSTAENPTDRNAFHTIALRGYQQRNPIQLNPKLEKLIEKATDNKANGTDDHVKKQIMDYNEYLGNDRIKK